MLISAVVVVIVGTFNLWLAQQQQQQPSLTSSSPILESVYLRSSTTIFVELVAWSRCCWCWSGLVYHWTFHGRRSEHKGRSTYVYIYIYIKRNEKIYKTRRHSQDIPQYPKEGIKHQRHVHLTIIICEHLPNQYNLHIVEPINHYQ